MKAVVENYTNAEGKQAFKVVAPYMDNNKLKSKVRKFNPSTHFASHDKPRKAAQEAAVAYCAKINEIGHEQFFTEFTLLDAIKPYLESKQNDFDNEDLSYKELQNIKYQCNELIGKTKFATIPVKELVADDCKKLISQLRELGCSHDKIRRCLFDAKAMMDTCVSKKIIGSNNLRAFKFKNRKRKVKEVELIEIPSKEDLAALEKNSTGVYNAIVCTVPWLGMRWQDWAALKWSDIGWNSNTIHINSFVSRTDDGTENIKQRGKTDAAKRSIPMYGKVKEKLREWQKDKDSCDQFVFGKDGKWIVYETARRNFMKLKKKSNCKYHGGLHAFRHYYASFLFDSKVYSDLQIAAFIGHEDPGFTMKRYAKCFNDHDKWLNGIDKIDALLGGC